MDFNANFPDGTAQKIHQHNHRAVGRGLGQTCGRWLRMVAAGAALAAGVTWAGVVMGSPIASSSVSVSSSVSSSVSVAAGSAAGPEPVRVVDTRVAWITTTVDGQDRSGRPVMNGETIQLFIGPDPVVLNTVAVGSSGYGFATVFPCAQGRPTASNLNFGPHEVIANTAIASPDQHGNACIYFEIVGARGGKANKVDVVVDQYSAIPAATLNTFRPVRQYDSRQNDSRPGSGAIGDGRRAAGSVKRLSFGVPNQPVVLNVTATEPAAMGIFTVYPCAAATPNASNLNFERGETRAAMVVVNTNDQGDVCVFTSADTHMIVDWSGTFARGETARQSNGAMATASIGDQADGGTYEFFVPTRLIDTRENLGGTKGRLFSVDLTEYRTKDGVIVQANNRAAMINVTVVAPTAHGFVTVYPCGNGTVPNASLVNYPDSRYATPNAVLIQPDSANRVCFYSEAVSHLVVDLFGFVGVTDDTSRGGAPVVTTIPVGAAPAPITDPTTTIYPTPTIDYRVPAPTTPVTDPTTPETPTTDPRTPETTPPDPPTPAPPTPAPGTSTPSGPQPIMSTLSCHQIADAASVTTAWRAEKGVRPLAYDEAMYRGAAWWATYLATTDEWRHTTASEAIANGQAYRKAEVIAQLDTVTAWKISAPHMNAITDPLYTKAGFAFCQVRWTNDYTQRIAVGWLDY